MCENMMHNMDNNKLASELYQKYINLEKEVNKNNNTDIEDQLDDIRDILKSMKIPNTNYNDAWAMCTDMIQREEEAYCFELCQKYIDIKYFRDDEILSSIDREKKLGSVVDMMDKNCWKMCQKMMNNMDNNKLA